MNIMNHLIMRTSICRKMVKTIKMLKKMNASLLATCECMQTTINELSQDLEKYNSEYTLAFENPEENKKDIKQKKDDFQAFEKIEPVDEVLVKAEAAMEHNILGPIDEEYPDIIDFQALTEKDLKDILSYCRMNHEKQIKIDIEGGEGILESYADNELSCGIYDKEGKHVKTIMTGEKIIDGKLVNAYKDSDIIQSLKEFQHKEAE